MKRIFAAARDAVGEEPIAAGGVHTLRWIKRLNQTNETKTETSFTTAHDAIG